MKRRLVSNISVKFISKTFFQWISKFSILNVFRISFSPFFHLMCSYRALYSTSPFTQLNAINLVLFIRKFCFSLLESILFHASSSSTIQFYKLISATSIIILALLIPSMLICSCFHRERTVLTSSATAYGQSFTTLENSSGRSFAWSCGEV